MQSKMLGKVVLFYHPEDQETAQVIESACEKAVQLAGDQWGLPEPENCRIYVMTSWWEFVFQSAPWPWQLLLVQSIPFWVGRVRRTWPYSGGWTQRYGRRVAIGVKTLSLLEHGDRSIGAHIFVEEKDMKEKVQHITCHELVHACSAHLKLPFWLNEGLAMVTVDRFLNKTTIKPETLELLRNYDPKASPPTYREVSRMDGKAIAYHSVRGYWLVRFLEEKHPGFIRRVFSLHMDARQIEGEMADLFAMQPARFWSLIDGLVAGHFESQEV